LGLSLPINDDRLLELVYFGANSLRKAVPYKLGALELHEILLSDCQYLRLVFTVSACGEHFAAKNQILNAEKLHNLNAAKLLSFKLAAEVFYVELAFLFL
jgi:hypothetical protein